MSYCTKCGYQLNDDMQFCPKCGTAKTILVEESTTAVSIPETACKNAAKMPTVKKKSSKPFGVAALVLVIIAIVSTIGPNNVSNKENAVDDSNSTSKNESTVESIQIIEKSGEDYESLVWEAFWGSASDAFGVEYSDYKAFDTVTDYIKEFETSDGYTSYYYLIRTAFETTNAFGTKIKHPVTARCYYVPDYSDIVYVAYMSLDGEDVLYDEETENWLMSIGTSKDSETDYIDSGKSTGLLWSDFLSYYNEFTAAATDVDGYLIDTDSKMVNNTINYSFQNNETLEVALTDDQRIIRMEYTYPSADGADNELIMSRWWVISSMVSTVQCGLNNFEWNQSIEYQIEDILADIALAKGTDEDKQAYQDGKSLTSSDLENSIIYTRYLDKENSESHFIIYGYSENLVATMEAVSDTVNTFPSDNTSEFLKTTDMNEFLYTYILPQHVTLQGSLHDIKLYDSNEGTDWCYKLTGSVGNDTYEAMVYPFAGIDHVIDDLWIRYLYWNGTLVVENNPSERIYYTPKKYW